MGRIVHFAGTQGIRIRDGAGGGEPVLTADDVDLNGDALARHTASAAAAVNGVDDQSHEAFTVERVYKPQDWEEERRRERGRPGYFCFTKTVRKPYDIVVVAALIRLAHRFPAMSGRISSDGEEWELQPALSWCHELFGEGILPAGMRAAADFRLLVYPGTHTYLTPQTVRGREWFLEHLGTAWCINGPEAAVRVHLPAIRAAGLTTECHTP